MIAVRQAGPEDIPALSALARHTYAETFGHSLSPEDLATQLEETRSEECFRKALESDIVLVAQDDDIIAGYVRLCDLRLPIEYSNSDRQLDSIYVHPDQQRKGVGALLLQAALAHPFLQDAEKLFLDVWEENEKAVRFYAKHGFEKAGYCDVKIGGRVIGQDMVMALRLDLNRE